MTLNFLIAPDFAPERFAGWHMLNTVLQKKTDLQMHLLTPANAAEQAKLIADGNVDLVYANPFDAAEMVRNAGFVAIALLLGGGLVVAGGRLPAVAAPPGSSAAEPPSVDITFKNSHPPMYPVMAVRSGEQGTVILIVTIDTAGKVAHLAVDPRGTTAAPLLQAAALTAAADWKFHPGRRHGKPVGGVVKIPVNYSLRGENGKSYVSPCGLNSQYVAQIKQCVKLVAPAAASAG